MSSSLDLSGKTTAELRTLIANAERVLADAKAPAARHAMAEALAAAARVQLAAKAPKPPVRANAKPSVVRDLAKEGCATIADAVALLAKEFDLTEATAKADTKQPHAALGKDGKAKVGGAEKAGLAAIDRYTSYRRGQEVAVLRLILPAGRTDGIDALWEAGTRKTGSEKVAGEEGALGTVYSGSDPTQAINAYRGLLARLAPKR